MSKITLTAAMIKSLAAFAAEDEQDAYTLSHSYIPAFDEFPGYSGLIAYSDSGDHGVLVLGDVRRDDNADNRNYGGGTCLSGSLINRNQEQVAETFHEHACTGEKNKSGAMPYTEEMKLHLMQLIINDDIEGLHHALNSSVNLIQG
ncbi:TPA: hypothetical protein ACJG9G_002267 [Salmonella enterica subsp. enterica serovar Java]